MSYTRPFGSDIRENFVRPKVSNFDIGPVTISRYRYVGLFRYWMNPNIKNEHSDICYTNYFFQLSIHVHVNVHVRVPVRGVPTHFHVHFQGPCPSPCLCLCPCCMVMYMDMDIPVLPKTVFQRFGCRLWVKSLKGLSHEI
jgi:hypothetical protein